MRRLVTGRLWGHAGFLKLWGGQTISQFGSKLTQLALPTVAIVLLHAGPFQLGLLNALEVISFPVLGLFAGVWVDRVRRRHLMILCDVGRAVTLASIPLAFSLHIMSLKQLYLVALVTGVFTVFFEVSYQSYLPSLVTRTDLLEGNSKLALSGSAARVTGPGVAGILIQLVGSAMVVIIDAVSFAASAVSLLLIDTAEPRPPGDRPKKFLVEMREGLVMVRKNPILWRIAGTTATSNIGTSMAMAVLLIWAYRDLRLTPGVVGLIFSLGSVGFFAGALGARQLALRLGMGKALAVSITLIGVGTLIAPLAVFVAPIAVLVVADFLQCMGGPLYDVNQVSLRQAITPDVLQGRMNATMRTIVWGTIPIGALLGGVLGSSIGLVPTIVVGGLISTTASVFILRSPVMQLRAKETL